MAQNRLVFLRFAGLAIATIVPHGVGVDSIPMVLSDKHHDFPKPNRRAKATFGGQSLANPRHHARKNPRASHKTRQYKK